MKNNRLILLVLSFFAVFTLSLMAPLQARAWGRFEGGYHPGFDHHFHQDPVIVHNVYVNRGHGGCVGCGVGFAAVAGFVAGAVIANEVAHPEPQTVIVENPPPQTVIVQGPAYGTQYAMLPGGCVNMNVNGATYYRCNQFWYQPFMGGNGVYYTLIPAPM